MHALNTQTQNDTMCNFLKLFVEKKVCIISNIIVSQQTEACVLLLDKKCWNISLSVEWTI